MLYLANFHDERVKRAFACPPIHIRSHPIYSSQSVSSLITSYAGIRSFQSYQKLVFEETLHSPRTFSINFLAIG